MTNHTYEDVSPSAADIMTAKDSHGEVQGRYRPMRGQAYVQVIHEKSKLIITPDPDSREVQSHRGRVLALGPPARLTDHPDSPVVPWGCKVGDEVVYAMFVWLDKMRVMAFAGVNGEVCIVAQGELCGVVQ
jgi:co-chaperonin GroES (HSP10)